MQERDHVSRNSELDGLPEDIQYRVLASPALSLRDLALATPSCKLFQAAYKARCAADEAWAEEGITSTLGPLVHLVISFLLGPNWPWGYQNVDTVELPSAPPYPDGSSLTAWGNHGEATVEGLFGPSHERVHCVLHNYSHCKRVYIRGAGGFSRSLELIYGLDGAPWDQASIQYLIVGGEVPLLPFVKLAILLLKAKAAAKTQDGIAEGERTLVVELDGPVTDTEEDRRANMLLQMVHKRAWPRIPLPWCSPHAF